MYPNNQKSEIRNQKSAFTLVELLVVITIIGILIALLLPAVQAAREAARRLQCTNNLKQLSLAMLAHEEIHGFFPGGGLGTSWTGDPDAPPGVNQPGGWSYAILPFIEQQAVYDMGSDGNANTVTAQQRQGALRREQIPLTVFTCPSRRPTMLFPRPYHIYPWMYYINGPSAAELTTAGGMEYCINAGVRIWYGADWTNPKQPPWDGDGIAGAGFVVKMADITDGASNTFMLGEKYINPDWYFTGEDHGDDHGMYEGHGVDSARWCTINPYDPGFPGAYTPKQEVPGGMQPWIFGSPHAGSCSFAFCDGSVQAINYSIEPLIATYLANRHDGRTIDAKKF
ncbi:MAG: DUF1559 domain-containing protein [Planctomycetes bacterium]|nr:DUF1559 domain-containing protein [Planctomycetota bacterium]MCG2682266.1 DUF1559 domain-containing protein [Planctomycetales bacterium]